MLKIPVIWRAQTLVNCVCVIHFNTLLHTFCVSKGTSTKAYSIRSVAKITVHVFLGSNFPLRISSKSWQYCFYAKRRFVLARAVIKSGLLHPDIMTTLQISFYIIYIHLRHKPKVFSEDTGQDGCFDNLVFVGSRARGKLNLLFQGCEMWLSACTLNTAHQCRICDCMFKTGDVYLLVQVQEECEGELSSSVCTRTRILACFDK